MASAKPKLTIKTKPKLFLILHSSFFTLHSSLFTFHFSLFVLRFYQFLVDFLVRDNAFVFPRFELFDDVACTRGKLSLCLVEGSVGSGDFAAEVGERIGERGEFLV